MAISKEQLVIELRTKGVALTKAQLGQLDKSTQGTTKSFGAMAAGIAGATAAMYALGKAMKVGAEFEASMAKVLAVSDATETEFKALTKTARDLGASTAFTASEVSGLQTEFAKLGFTATEINKVTKGTLDLAGATGTDLATAASTAGSTLRGFGLDVSETGRVTNLMAASFSKSALDMTKFSDSMKYVAPVAKLAGFEVEGTTAMLGQLANAGIDGSMAGTALRKVFLELSNENSKLSKRLGGSVSSVDELIPALKRLNKEGVSTAEMKELVGQRAISAFSILLDGADTLGTVTDEITGTIEASRQYDVMMNTMKGSTDKMNSAFANLGITMFDMADGPLRAVVDLTTKLVASLDEEALKSYATGLGIVALGFGIYKKAVIAARIQTILMSRAMMATGIGALAVIAGLAAGKIIELTGAFGDAEDAAEGMNDEIENSSKAVKAFEEDIGETLVDIGETFAGVEDMYAESFGDPDIGDPDELAKRIKKQWLNAMDMIVQYSTEARNYGTDSRIVALEQEEKDMMAALDVLNQHGELRLEIEEGFRTRGKILADEILEEEAERLGKELEQQNIFYDSYSAGYDAFIGSLLDMDINGKERREAIWEAMKGSFVAFLGDMLKEWIKDQIIRIALGKQAEAATIASATVTGTAVASAWAAAAAAASLATLGSNAAAASAGMVATHTLSKSLAKAQYGMDEVVDKPTMILAGEAGAEQVSITPLEGPNKNGPQGGNTYVSVSVTGNVMTQEFTEEQIIPTIKEALRKGADLDHKHAIGEHNIGIGLAGDPIWK